MSTTSLGAEGLLRSISFRTNAILKGEIVVSKEFVTPIELERIIVDSNDVLYITIEAGTNDYYHILTVNKKIIGCVNELKSVEGSNCINELMKLLESRGNKLKVKAYRLTEEVLGDKAEALKKYVLEKADTGSSIEKVEATGLKGEETLYRATTGEVEGLRENIGFLEYKLSNELDKLGYMVDEITITRTRRDIVVFVKLLRSSKPPSLYELSSIIARHICTDLTVPEKLGVEIEHRKKKLIEIDLMGRIDKCLLIGGIAEKLRNYGLILTGLELSEAGDKVTLLINAKKLPGEITYKPREAAKEIKYLAKNLLGKNVCIIMKTGLIGGRVEA